MTARRGSVASAACGRIVAPRSAGGFTAPPRTVAAGGPAHNHNNFTRSWPRTHDPGKHFALPVGRPGNLGHTAAILTRYKSAHDLRV